MSDQFIPGTDKPEEDYRELQRLSAKVGIPVPEMFLTVEYTDPDGNTRTVYDGRSRTYVRNYWNTIFLSGTPRGSTTITSRHTGEGRIEVRAIDNTLAGYTASTGYEGWNAADSSDTATVAGVGIGIVVGSGTRPEAFDTHSMDVRIAHGTGAGQLQYGNQSTSTPAFNTNTRVMSTTSSRPFSNNSGGDVTVTEVGLYWRPQINGSGTTALVCRDVLAAPVVVANGGTVTFSYRWQMTYPANTLPANSPFSEVQAIIGNESGANGGTTFTDQSSYARTISTIGTPPQWSNTTAPTGLSTSIRFVGTGQLSLADDPALELGGNDFEISFLYYTTIAANSHTTGETLIAKQATSAGFSPVRVYWSTAAVLTAAFSLNGSTQTTLSHTSSAIAASTWYYVSVTRYQGCITFRTGAISGGATNSYGSSSVSTLLSRAALVDNASPWTVGGNADGSGPLLSTSYIAALRITIGSCRLPGSNTIYTGGGPTTFISNNATNIGIENWALPLSTSV